MLSKMNPCEFDAVYAILEESFPPDERRPYSLQKQLLDRDDYQILVLRDEDSRSICAIMAVYTLEHFIFLEHFAVHAKCRSQGLGAMLLQELIRRTDKPVCLEAEPPAANLAARRIRFYERNGFFLNPYPYRQPSLAPGQGAVPLQIMSSSGILSWEEFQAVKDTLYRQVYGQHPDS